VARILVVDDEEGIRSFIAEALERDGHEVTQAGDADEATRHLDSRGFHVMITDLRMPGQDGMTLVRKSRAEQPETEVLVLTAHGTIDTALEAMKLGAYDYLQKPVASPEELRLIIARAVERRALRDHHEGTRDGTTLIPLTYGDPAMVPIEDALRKVAPTNATVLLTGESGTGKEIAARTVHAWSARAQGPFIAMNCAALSETLLESELFGHEKGAFTGAVTRRRGRVELADGGSFFLDELAELKPELQAKLLRLIQERRFERLGGTRTIESDVRWIAATNRNLRTMIEEGRFREDLYHRLAVFPIHLPPLRERRRDILPLADALLVGICRGLGRPLATLNDDARAQLERRSWRGNIRELANTLERAVILAEGSTLEAAHFQIEGDSTAPPSPQGSLADLEREAIKRALVAASGNRKQAAEQLGIGLRTLYDKLKRYGLD